MLVVVCFLVINNYTIVSNTETAVCPLDCKWQRGVKGEKGDEGPKGFGGPRGPGGLKGDKGDEGPKGFGGPRGSKGDKGVVGEKGLQGLLGFTGMSGNTGPRGPIGVKGDIGQKGNKGEMGRKGEKGLSGESCVNGTFDFKTDHRTAKSLKEILLYASNTTDLMSLLVNLTTKELANNVEALSQLKSVLNMADKTIYSGQMKEQVTDEIVVNMDVMYRLIYCIIIAGAVVAFIVKCRRSKKYVHENEEATAEEN